jgi:hypothetical protein
LRGERGAFVQQLHVDGPVRHRHEIGNAAVAIHHQAQRRRLHPAHRQHALITGLAPKQGEQPAHVHADQPIGAAATQRRMVKAEGLGPRFQVARALRIEASSSADSHKRRIGPR